jgi:hypothetical protein
MGDDGSDTTSFLSGGGGGRLILGDDGGRGGGPRLCIPAGFPGIPAGTPFLQIFYGNYVPAKHRKDRNGLSLHLAFVRRS